MLEHSDNDVIKEVLDVVEKFLAGTINSQELYTFMHVVSHAKLMSNLPKSNTKDIETAN